MGQVMRYLSKYDPEGKHVRYVEKAEGIGHKCFDRTGEIEGSGYH